MKNDKGNNCGFLSLLVIFTMIGLAGCHNSYYAASVKNENRLGGEKKEVAEVMVELNDYFLLLEDMNELAKDEASEKETYLVAKELQNKFNKLQSDLEIRSVLQKVVLPDELSESHDDFYQKVYVHENDSFDETYQELSEQKLNQLKEVLVNNLKDPVNEYVQNMSNRFLDDVRIAINQIENLKS